MLARRPLAHIISAFRNQTQYGIWTESMDLRQVCSQQSIKSGTHVESRLIPTLCMPGLRQRLFGPVTIVVEPVQNGFNLSIAFSDLRLVELIQLQCLPQCENVLGTIITSERSADGLWRSGAADIAILSQLFGRMDPGHDSPDD